MANRKSASKQAAGGGAPRSPIPQPANKNRSGVNTGNPGKASSKSPAPSHQPIASSKPQTRIAPKPPQPQAANRSSNGTKSQGTTGNGAPKSQGASDPAQIFGRGKHQEIGTCPHELCRPTYVYTGPVGKARISDEYSTRSLHPS
jgi:hypothetical protein